MPSWAQTTSQLTEQHVGSMPQTLLQQSAYSQPGEACGAMHDSCPGRPHSTGFPPLQNASAWNAHAASHVTEQHAGSDAHTAEQHASSLQPGLACAVRQLPLACAPHRPWQYFSASATHAEVHASEQQRGSRSHTVVQHVASEQPPPACGSRQLPDEPPHCACADGAAHATAAVHAAAIHRADFRIERFMVRA